jgi:hypothetical protein
MEILAGLEKENFIDRKFFLLGNISYVIHYIWERQQNIKIKLMTKVRAD